MGTIEPHILLPVEEVWPVVVPVTTPADDLASPRPTTVPEADPLSERNPYGYDPVSRPG